ncbi:unnamed protein product [Blepharisma stoltei]|uniref:Uncharacterized protein n=1 Tax=Blepharisma stoltei TaxID=1481888 RepID=A0AAU9IZL6_9CILI|nr:unnamed protein product [Blepharisma stoltei]
MEISNATIHTKYNSAPDNRPLKFNRQAAMLLIMKKQNENINLYRHLSINIVFNSPYTPQFAFAERV